jgi:hypothetical protein
MAIGFLTRNNENQYRKYPLKQDSILRALNGYILPDDLFVNCSITSTYGRHRIYIQQVFYKDNFTKITIASVPDNLHSSVTLGAFTGAITEDFTTLPLIPFIKNVSGNITIGSFQSLSKIGSILVFDKSMTELEESTIFCYTPPALKSIADLQNNKLTGYVNFGNLTNVSKSTRHADGVTQLQVTNPASVFNIADTSSALGNCSTPVIKSINGVEPSPAGQDNSPGNDGNIYVVGVKPLVFFGEIGDSPGTYARGAVKLESSGVTLDSLCSQKTKLLPPTNTAGLTASTSLDQYYSKPALPSMTDTGYPYPIPARRASNFSETTRPEYYYWPQFVKQEYYEHWSLIK